MVERIRFNLTRSLISIFNDLNQNDYMFNTNGNKLVFAKEKDIGNVTWNIMDIEFSNRNEYEVEQI